MKRVVKKTSKKQIFAALAVGFAAVIGISIYLILKPTDREVAFTPPKQSELRQTSQDVSVNCSRVSGALLCANTANKTTKYRLPNDVARAASIIPSRDEARYLVIAANNPLQSSPVKRVVITDEHFTTLREVPAKDVAQSGDFAWAGSSDYIIYTKSANDNKVDVMAMEAATGSTITISKQPVAARQPFTSSDGKTIYMNASKTGSRFELTTINTDTGEASQANTDDVAKHLSQFANYHYDSATNRLYIVGSRDNAPVLVVATFDNGVVSVRKTIDDGFAYTPLSLTKGGVMVSRVKDGQKSYGAVSADGSFTATTYAPRGQVVFGLSRAPQLDASTTARLAASDFTHSYTSQPSEAISRLMNTKTAPTTDCTEPAFTQVDLLAVADNNKQFSLAIAPCAPGSTAKRVFYRQAGNSYAEVLSSKAAPTCSQLDSLKLSHTLSPECTLIAPDTAAPSSATTTTPDPTQLAPDTTGNSSDTITSTTQAEGTINSSSSRSSQTKLQP